MERRETDFKTDLYLEGYKGLGAIAEKWTC